MYETNVDPAQVGKGLTYLVSPARVYLRGCWPVAAMAAISFSSMILCTLRRHLRLDLNESPRRCFVVDEGQGAIRRGAPPTTSVRNEVSALRSAPRRWEKGERQEGLDRSSLPSLFFMVIGPWRRWRWGCFFLLRYSTEVGLKLLVGMVVDGCGNGYGQWLAGDLSFVAAFPMEERRNDDGGSWVVVDGSPGSCLAAVRRGSGGVARWC